MAVPLKKKADRIENDKYETPTWVVESFLDLVPIRKDWTYLEPCRASGRFYGEMPLGSAWGEISEGVDYLKTEYSRVDCILTNPPYNLAQQFVEKAHKDADVVITLLRIGFLESMRRFDFWENYPVDHLVTISKRPSFTDDGKTDGAAYAFFIWDPKGKLGLKKPFYWIKPKK